VAVRTNRRISDRIFTRVRLRYGLQRPEADGFALNISAEGLFVSGARLHLPGTRLHIRLEPPGAEGIELDGTVRWGLRVPQQLISIVKPGMGVLLSSPPRAYLDFFTSLASSKIKRAYPRVEARLEVRYYHRKHFLKEYTETISQGGFFIATEEPFERDAEVRIELVIPDLVAPLPVTGRVAYCLDAKQAAALGTTPGIGVQITAMDPKTDETLRAYVQRLMRLYE
jgi:uncharacterized protein (TIGR02266 family)